MIEQQKIAEIAHRLTGSTVCTKAPCPFTGEEQRGVSQAECAECGTADILALIEQEQKDREGELTVAYMLGAEARKAKQKPLVEALEAAYNELLQFGFSKKGPTLTQIASALKGVGR